MQRKYLVPAVFTAALAGGGLAGAVLGVPGVSFAQETGETPTTVDDGTTTTPDTQTEDDATPDGSGQNRGDGNCPDKADAEAEGSTS
jgi:hypothetical protein